MLSFENVHSFEPTGSARALAVVEKGDGESARLSDLLMDSALKVPIGKIRSCCGENVDLIGATIGGPNTVAEPVDVFRNVFHRIVIASTDTYFDPREPNANADELRRLSRKCQYDKAHSSFGEVGDMAVCCRQCRMLGMVDVKNKRCLCGKVPSRP